MSDISDMQEDVLPPPPPPPEAPGPPENRPRRPKGGVGEGGRKIPGPGQGMIKIGRGKVNEIQRQDGMTHLAFEPLGDSPSLRSWEHAEVWVKPLEAPDARIVYEQYRQDPDTGLVWQIVGRNTEWACVEGTESTRPEVFPVALVAGWDVVSGR